MPQCSESQWVKIHDYLTEVGTARDINQMLRLALVRIGDLVPFDNTGIIGFQDSRGVTIQEAFNVIEKTVNEFTQYYCKVIPDIGWNFLQYSSVDWDEYEGTEYVTDFIRPNYLRSSVGMILGRNGLGNIAISINRSRDLPCFNDTEMSNLKVIQEHLVNYVAMLTCSHPRDSAPDANDIRSVFSVLTRRESEIAALVCRKYSAEMIGSQLLISPLTVYKHLENIYEKLKVNSRKDLRVKLLELK